MATMASALQQLQICQDSKKRKLCSAVQFDFSLTGWLGACGMDLRHVDLLVG